MIGDLSVNEAAMRRAAAQGYATATDLADWLVRAAGLPFREAHHATGRIVALAEGRGLPLHRLALADMQAIEPRITEDVFSVLSVDRSVRSRTSEGGTAPANVRRAARRWLKRLERERSGSEQTGKGGDSVDGTGEGGFTPAARSA
jgi:argininosuccinate lyase